MHLAKRRPTDPAEKFNSEHADEVFKWIEPAFEQFLEKLTPELRAYWNEERSKPESFGLLLAATARNTSAPTYD